MKEKNLYPQFSIEEGLKVQAHNLEFWKTVLKKKYYNKLVLSVQIEQSERPPMKDGFDVVRGSDISSIVQNILLSDYSHIG
jgi:hypothetical protein